MKKKIFILIILTFSLIHTSIQAEILGEMPEETAILELPDGGEANWKKITHHVNKQSGVIELIPLSQTIQNWSELISIFYFNSSGVARSACSVEKFVSRLREEIRSSYPKNTVTFQIIERNKNGILYEWILHKPYKDIPVQHEVAQAFFTRSGFHRIGFTRKHGHLSSEEKEKWVKLLRENSSVISFQEAVPREGLSMVEKLKTSLSLGSYFQDWIMIKPITAEDGSSLISFFPPPPGDGSSIECLLSVTTTPNLNGESLAQLFEKETTSIKKSSSKEINVHILEQSSKELIYSCSYPKDQVQFEIVTRMFLTDHGSYSICYRTLKEHMQKEEIASWQEKLKTISVKSPKKSTKTSNISSLETIKGLGKQSLCLITRVF